MDSTVMPDISLNTSVGHIQHTRDHRHRGPIGQRLQGCFIKGAGEALRSRAPECVSEGSQGSSGYSQEASMIRRRANE